jgi:hypothetical protein
LFGIRVEQEIDGGNCCVGTGGEAYQRIPHCKTDQEENKSQKPKPIYKTRREGTRSELTFTYEECIYGFTHAHFPIIFAIKKYCRAVR